MKPDKGGDLVQEMREEYDPDSSRETRAEKKGKQKNRRRPSESQYFDLMREVKAYSDERSV